MLRAPDFYNGVKMVLNYLIMKGHKKIGYVPPVKYRTKGVGGNDFRTKAYTDTLRENGLEINPDFFCTHTQTIADAKEDVFKMLTAFPVGERPTAIAVGDDRTAAQIIKYVKKLGLKVPDDVAIVGWGNAAMSQVTDPELTTVDDGIPVFAEEVADVLARMVRGEHPENKFYSGKLIIREST